MISQAHQRHPCLDLIPSSCLSLFSQQWNHAVSLQECFGGWSIKQLMLENFQKILYCNIDLRMTPCLLLRDSTTHHQAHKGNECTSWYTCLVNDSKQQQGSFRSFRDRTTESHVSVTADTWMDLTEDVWPVSRCTHKFTINHLQALHHFFTNTLGDCSGADQNGVAFATSTLISWMHPYEGQKSWQLHETDMQYLSLIHIWRCRRRG